MQSSIHAARWIECIADQDWDLHMFGVDDHPPNPSLRGVTVHMPVPPPGVSPRTPSLLDRAINFAGRFCRDPRSAIGTLKARLRTRRHLASAPPSDNTTIDHRATIVRFVPEDLPGHSTATGKDLADRYSPAVLASVIKRLRPDLIHSMEFQHNAYRVLAARNILGAQDFPPWLATNWGSDIFLFGRQPDHAERIRDVLAAADLYSCECHRDVALGREFGYRGPELPVLPNSGGMDMRLIATLRHAAPPSRRKLIMVKGYDHFAGRAMTSLAVLERFQEELKNYKVVLYSAGKRPRAKAFKLKDAGTLDIKVIDWATHEDILRHFGQARLYLGISVSDAISTSVLEAMAMGAFPIQTNTSCCEEWFEDGVGGFAIPPDDFELICSRFARALADDALVDSAAVINLATIRTRLAQEVISPRVRDFYQQAFGHLAKSAEPAEG